MELVKNEAIYNGLHISMPVPGIVRVTDGNHKKGSYMVSARLRKSTPRSRASVWSGARSPSSPQRTWLCTSRAGS
jgi:hypothetical protein